MRIIQSVAMRVTQTLPGKIAGAIGRAASAVAGLALLATAPASAQSLIRDTEIEHMLRDFTDPLLVAAELRPADVDLFIINDPEINAFVTGGQNIFVHTGTIVEAESPLQLIGVLSHETGHIAGAHLVRSSDAMRDAAGPMYLTLGLGLLAALAGEGRAAGALMASSQQFGAANFFIYTQAQESSADQAGLRYLEEVGHSGEGLLSFFERFRAQEVMSLNRRMPYFRTHPPPSDRISAIRQRITDSPHYGQPASDEDTDRLRRAQAKIYGFTRGLQYTLFRYPESDQSIYGRYARASAYYIDGRLDRAREEIESLLEDEPDNPYFHELYGQMLYEHGLAEESLPHHRRSVELEPTAPLLRINLARALAETEGVGHVDEAIDHLEVALDIEPRNGFAWYTMAQLHERQGDTALAQLATAEQNYSIGNAGNAFRFAAMALPELEQGSRDWDRATQIISWAQSQGGEAVRGGGGSRRR